MVNKSTIWITLFIIFLCILASSYSYRKGYNKGTFHEECRIDLQMKEGNQYFMVSVANKRICELMRDYTNKGYTTFCKDMGDNEYRCEE